MFRAIAIRKLAILFALTGLAAAQTPGGTSNASTGAAASTTTEKLPGVPATQPAAQPSAPAPAPVTRIETPASAAEGSSDPLLEVPPLPDGKVTMLGGIATSVDKVRNHLTVQPFGDGKKMKLQFDERTHIYRDGRETTVLGINKGDRVYVDTQLVGPTLFARNIHVKSAGGGVAADARGQVLQVEGGRVTMRDQLSGQQVSFVVTPESKIARRNGAGSFDDVKPGALIQVSFTPEHGGRGNARDITVLATPGAEYVFAGKVTHLDMRMGVMAIENATDGMTYEVHFDPRSTQARELAVGSDVSATAVFDGKGYSARGFDVSHEVRADQK